MNYGSRLAKIYATNDVETGVACADPNKLVLMLYDGAIGCIRDAKVHLAGGDVELRAQAVAKALRIIDEGLRTSLDKNAGGELAMRLDSLYAYIAGRLLLASARQDPSIFDEARRLLEELRGAWQTLCDATRVAPQPQEVSA